MRDRVARFISAARLLLLMQVGAALFALILAVWAVVVVRELAAERDRLREQVAALEARQSGPAAEAPVGPPQPTPLDTELRPPPILPLPVPIPVEAVPVDPLLNGTAPPGTGSEAPPIAPPPAGTNQVRTRPGRWSPPVVQPSPPETLPKAAEPATPKEQPRQE